MDCSPSRSVQNRRGQALSEYAILVAMVGMGLVVILGLFGQATKRVWLKSESSFAGEPSVASGGPSPAPVGGGGGGSGGGGGGSGSGSVHPTPPPSSPPTRPPKGDSSDSSSAGDGAPDNPVGQAPQP